MTGILAGITEWKPRGDRTPAINGQWDAVVDGVDVRAWDETGGNYWTAYGPDGMRHPQAPKQPLRAPDFAAAKKAAEDFVAGLKP